MATAKMYKRVIAFFIDRIVSAVLMAPVWIQMSISAMKDRVFQVEIRILVLCLVMVFLYHWIFLRLLGGTFGKLLMGLRVVRSADEGDLSWIQSFLRVLTDQISYLFGSAHRALAFGRFDRTHLSDWVAETRVVQLAPRSDYPKRHLWLAGVLVIYLAIAHFFQAYQFIQRSEIEVGQLIIHPVLPELSIPEPVE